jgi:hypothetical protein
MGRARPRAFNQEVSVSNPSKVVDQAEVNFKKMQQARDAELARAQYEAEGIALRERTERLRALRLAKEAEAELAGTAARPQVGTIGADTPPPRPRTRSASGARAKSVAKSRSRKAG